MKINIKEDYIKLDTFDNSTNKNINKTDFKTSFIDVMNRVSKNELNNKLDLPSKKDTLHNKFKDTSVLNLNSFSNKGTKVISEFNKFLKSKPTKHDFLNAIKSIKDTILFSEDGSVMKMDDLSDEELLDKVMNLLSNYNNTNLQNLNTDEDSLFGAVDVNLSDILGSVNEIDTNIFNDNSCIEELDLLDKSLDTDNLISSTNLYAVNPLFNLENQSLGSIEDTLNEPIGLVPVNNENGLDSLYDLSNTDMDSINSLEDLLDSSEEKLESLSESLKLTEEDSKDSNLVFKKILELANDNSNLNKEDIDNIVKKEDIGINTNNLITSSISLDKIALNQTTNIENPIVNSVLESIYSQLSNESLNDKTVELRLKLFPSKLGSVSVIIEKDGASLNIKILSDNPEVRELFMDSMQDLKSELDKTNSSKVNIDISNTNQDSNHNKNQSKDTLTGANIVYKNTDDYIEDISAKISSNNAIIDKILDIKI